MMPNKHDAITKKVYGKKFKKKGEKQLNYLIDWKKIYIFIQILFQYACKKKIDLYTLNLVVIGLV